jgi:prepilin-type N-terminal cleavage/methylation domain-containing protein
MRKSAKTTDGFTLIEMLLTIAILSILVAIATASYDALKANVRFSKVKGDMDGIAKAAISDYSNTNVWAPLTFGAMPAVWTATNELSQWPTPPCPGWYYSWEDWSAFGYPVTQVTLRRANNTLLWGYCVDTLGGSGSCQVADPIFGGGSAQDLITLNTHSAYCNE